MKILDQTTRRWTGLSWHLQRALSWIPDGDLFGIEEIVIKEQLGPATSISPDWHHKIEGRNLAVSGQYFGRYGDEPPTIVLYVASLYRGIPKIYWFSPVITLRLASTLAHEVGHHLIDRRGYIFEREERVKPPDYEEELARRYSFSVRKRMLRRWYYRVADWLTRDLAEWHYVIGIVDFRKGLYENAATRWEITFCLDPNRADADDWYYEAKRAQATKTQNG